MPYAATIFLSSFLLFLVQPLIARLILPWFGGTAAVWTTCMLFFQTLLLAGYAYAHATSARMSPRAQALLHTALLAAAALLMPVAPGESWKPAGREEPISYILAMLFVAVGLPYLLLAATSPLVQAWFAAARPGENPYRLFAVSNFASPLALVGYPLFFEPYLGSAEQVRVWSWLFGAFALLCAALAWMSAKAPHAVLAAPAAAPPPSARDYAMWIALSAAASGLLLAVTNHITQNVAAIPLLWIAPLTLYLASFIIAFEGRGLYRPQWLWIVVLACLGAMAWLLVDKDFQFDLDVQLGVFLSALFVACLFCHGELYRLRPEASRLTAFYLAVSAGGAIGGLLVAVVAPLAFNAYYELGLALVGLGVLAVLRFRGLGHVAHALSVAVLTGITGCAVYEGFRFQEDVSVSVRNFYGVLRVKEYGSEGEAGHLRRLVHGVIMHGEQYMDPARRGMLTSYYQPASGVGAAIASRDGQLRVGVIGLGVGTLAAYGRPGDTYRFYDINPDVVEIARRDFTYLSDSEAEIEIVLGDARLNLEREPPQQFDVLAVDAFSSDAIPVHLITREALAVYLRHMKPDGIVAFHVSNRFMQLIPVVARLARELGAHASVVLEESGDDSDRTQSDWVLVSRDSAALGRKAIVDAGAQPPDERPDWRTWTDDYSNLVQILK
ncbi:MAG: spermidine synthase [Burkholderiales bacterium]